MKKAVQNFIETYGRYMAVAAFASKPCSNREMQYIVELFRNDSQR